MSDELGTWKVRLWSYPDENVVRISIFRRGFPTPTQTQILLPPELRGGVPRLETINEQDRLEPFLVLSDINALEILQSFSDEIARFGLKSNNQSKIEGVLEATQKHLADMRHLLKLPKENV